MSKNIQHQRWKIKFKELLEKKTPTEIQKWIAAYLINGTVNEDLKKVFCEAVEEIKILLEKEPADMNRDDKLTLFTNVINQYNTDGSLESFEIKSAGEIEGKHSA